MGRTQLLTNVEHEPFQPLGLQPPPEKMVGVSLGGLTTF